MQRIRHLNIALAIVCLTAVATCIYFLSSITSPAFQHPRLIAAATSDLNLARKNELDDAKTSAPSPPQLQSVHLADFSYIHWPVPCSQKDPQPLLLGAIISAPRERSVRLLLRKLYMSVCEHRGFPLRWVFVLGSLPDSTLQAHIDKEAARFGDIIQLSFQDSYDNLTLKTLTAIDWTTAACPGAQFFFKIDSDCLVNPFRTVDFLVSLTMSQSQYLYAGTISDYLEPIRNSVHKKWRVSFENYPLIKFPPYPVGPGYVLSRAALSKVVAASRSTFPMKLEDVYVGMCAMRAGLVPKHLPHLFMMTGLNNYTDWCEYRTGVAIHPTESDAMPRMWKHMTAPESHNPPCGRAMLTSEA